MIKVRYAEKEDKEFWFRSDKHLPECEFDMKVRDKQGYILLNDEEKIGI